VTAGSPVPPEAFASALEGLDAEAFAAFVGEAYAATADAVEVSAPRITVVNGDRRTDLLAVSAASESVDDAAVDAAVDAIVVARDSLLNGDVPTEGVAVVTPADLRERLLYAMPPAEANAIAERALDAPMRSTTYPDPSGAGAAGDAATGDATGGADGDVTEGAGAGEEGGGGGGVETTPRGVPGTATDTEPASAGPTGTATAGSGNGRATGGAAAGGARPGPSAYRDADESGEADRSRTLVAAVVVVALLAAAAVGAATVGDGLAPGGTDELTDGGGADPGDSSPAGSDAADGSDGDDGDAAVTDDGAATADEGTVPTGDDADATASTDDGDPTNGTAGEAARNTDVAPTCERSALAVVQVQMNAFRYNDNRTNDGIRAARAFASPTNREAVGSVEQFVSLFETPSYAPMLTYDTAQYSVPRVDNDTAEIEVVTRENGSVTGRYEFRLVRVPGGSAGTSADLGDVDDCWMTRSVGATE